MAFFAKIRKGIILCCFTSYNTVSKFVLPIMSHDRGTPDFDFQRIYRPITVLGNKVPQKIFGIGKDDTSDQYCITRGYMMQYTATIMKYRRVWRTGHVARIGETS
jgi:hypothetical protein